MQHLYVNSDSYCGSVLIVGKCHRGGVFQSVVNCDTDGKTSDPSPGRDGHWPVDGQDLKRKKLGAVTCHTPITLPENVCVPVTASKNKMISM